MFELNTRNECGYQPKAGQPMQQRLRLLFLSGAENFEEAESVKRRLLYRIQYECS
jgi:hypothetical protein